MFFDDGEEDEQLRSAMKPKKKRKRIIQANDSSDEDDAKEKQKKLDDGKGRKNIRQFKDSSSLEENTKRAAREEKLRLERLAERQKLYNTICDKKNIDTETESKRLILDFDEDTKEILLEVDEGIVSHLKPHQSNGVKFMWEACFESIKQIESSEGSGCILAHCMGLGKTVSLLLKFT